MSTWLTPATTNPSFFPQVGTQVTITGSGGGSGAVVYAITTSGIVTGFNIVSGGSGYSGTITVTITGSGSAATATATQSGGVINSVTVGAGGTGYTGGAVTWRLNIAGNPWDTLLGYCGNWPSAVNGNQQTLSNLLSLGIIPAPGSNALTMFPPALSSAGTQAGAFFIQRANSYNTAGHTRDFLWQPATTDNAGDGGLFLFTQLDGAANNNILTILSNGYLGLGVSSPTSPLQVANIPAYANNAAAIAGGLSVGAFYRTGANPDPLCIVH